MKSTTFLSMALAFLSSSVTASPMTEDWVVSGLDERSTPITVTADMLTKMKLYAQYAAAAYCNADSAFVGKTVTCTNTACPLVQTNKATNYGYLGLPNSNVKGLVAIDPTAKLIVVSLKGTTNADEFIADINFPKSACDDLDTNCEIHTGFQNGWNDVSMTVDTVKKALAANAGYAVIVTGHSLGGAVATIAAAYLRKAGVSCDLYTYGSPRVGNEAFVDFVGRVEFGANIRVTHTDDPVPRWPGNIIGYKHTTPEFWLSTGTTTTTNYAIADIKVCEGIVNDKCNAGKNGVNLDAHSYYFQKISACKTP